MNRRKFLAGAAAGAGALAGLTTVRAQDQASAAPARGRQGGAAGAAAGRGRGRGPADVPASKLARISLMTLNFNSILKLPWTANPTPTQTVELFDLPQSYIETYGVTHMEFQNNHLAQGNSDPDPEFFKAMRAKLDAAKVSATQINIEIGVIANQTPEARAAWLVRAKKWVDAAPILGITRLMLNQTGLVEENKAAVISVWKDIQDYAKPKGIMISAEGRGTGAPRAGAPGAAGAPAAPPPAPTPTRPAWMLLEEVIEAAGGFSNIDIGGANAPNQQALNDAIKGMFKSSSGNMHMKSSPNWDIGTTVRFTESLGYKGFYSIEVNPDPAIRIVYNTILANLA